MRAHQRGQRKIIAGPQRQTRTQGADRYPQSKKFNQIIKLESVKLSSGDNLLLFTDGVTEARNNSGEEYGEERLSKVIYKSKNLSVFEIKENILDDIMNFVGNYPLHDDLTFIVIKRN